MSDKLQQAIQATRAGDTKNAQFLLTQAIQEDPNDPQSWYLLSLLVDDEEKKQAYLAKVIELDPDHAKAHEQLVAISETAVPEIESIEEPEPKAAAVVLSSDSSDLEAQDDGETLPNWMADDLPPTEDKAEETIIETEAIVEEEPMPDWLEGDLDEDWDGEEKTAVDEPVPDEPEDQEDEQPKEKTAVEKKETTEKEKKPDKEKKGLTEKHLNYIIIALIIIAIIIFFIMAYLMSTM